MKSATQLLAWAPPMSYEDTYFCMGASLGVSQGMSRLGIDTIAWIGDGTFFHAAIPALMNAVQTKTNIKIVVADNGVTAMTGFQPNPQSGKMATGEALTTELEDRIRKTLREGASPRHVPALILEAPDIPYTLNMKKVESAVTNILNNRPVLNEDALINPNSLEFYRQISPNLGASEGG